LKKGIQYNYSSISTIVIHGMEASIEKAVDIALNIIADNPDMDSIVETNTVPTLIEDAGLKKVR
jgi:hypothetical protein